MRFLIVIMCLFLPIVQQAVDGKFIKDRLLKSRDADSVQRKLDKILREQMQFNVLIKCMSNQRDEGRTLESRQKRLDCLVAAVTHRSDPQAMTVDEAQVLLQHLTKEPKFVAKSCKKIYRIERSHLKHSTTRNQYPDQLNDQLTKLVDSCRLIEEDVSMLIESNRSKSRTSVLRKLAF